MQTENRRRLFWPETGDYYAMLRARLGAPLERCEIVNPVLIGKYDSTVFVNESEARLFKIFAVNKSNDIGLIVMAHSKGMALANIPLMIPRELYDRVVVLSHGQVDEGLLECYIKMGISRFALRKEYPGVSNVPGIEKVIRVFYENGVIMSECHAGSFSST